MIYLITRAYGQEESWRKEPVGYCEGEMKIACAYVEQLNRGVKYVRSLPDWHQDGWLATLKILDPGVTPEMAYDRTLEYECRVLQELTLEGKPCATATLISPK